MKIGIILPNLNYPVYWQHQILNAIFLHPILELGLVIKMNRQLNDSILDHFTQKLAKFHLGREAFLLKEPILKEEKEAACSLASIPYIVIQNKANDKVLESDIGQIKKFELDLIINLNFFPMAPAFNEGAVNGVWEIKFGENYNQTDATIGFWETFNKMPVSKISLVKNASNGLIESLIDQGFYFRRETWIENKNTLEGRLPNLLIKNIQKLINNKMSFLEIPKNNISKQPKLSFWIISKYIFDFYNS